MMSLQITQEIGTMNLFTQKNISIRVTFSDKERELRLSYDQNLQV